MALLARADLESLLHTKKLDRTLTRHPRPELEHASTGHAALDVQLHGGVPRGQVSELIGPRSSGRTSLLCQMLAAATRRGELVALIDALDMFDVESAAEAGIDLDRLLWIRGFVVPNPGLCRDLNQRALVQAIRAFTLVLQAGQFGLVAFDAGEAPADAIRPGCGCSAWSKAPRPPACWSDRIGWPAVRRGSRCMPLLSGTRSSPCTPVCIVRLITITAVHAVFAVKPH